MSQLEKFLSLIQYKKAYPRSQYVLRYSARTCAIFNTVRGYDFYADSPYRLILKRWLHLAMLLLHFIFYST